MAGMIDGILGFFKSSVPSMLDLQSLDQLSLLFQDLNGLDTATYSN